MSELNMSEFEALLILNAVDAFGSVRLKKLLQFFGSAEKTLSASVAALTQSGILTTPMMQRLKETRRSFDPAKEISKAKKNGIRILTLHDADYPPLLKKIYDPPWVLYLKGDFQPCDVNAIGIVGSRGASFYGLSCAKEFSGFLSRAGLTIVSGMARGIDTAAHRAALDAGGRTCAVLGSGLLDIYPPENEKLFSEIAEKGVVVSEFPLTTPPLAKNFPVRNRIISGLSVGVLVVEATQKSGALITARFAAEEGREVFAIPGKVSSETSFGAHELIKDGAKMVTRPEEILEDLRFNFTPSSAPGFKKNIPGGGLEPQEEKVARILDDEPKGLEDISLLSGLKASELLVVLTHLELKRAIQRLPGQMFVKIS